MNNTKDDHTPSIFSMKRKDNPIMTTFLIGSKLVNPGDIIEFRYNSGSNPGAIRVVKVREIKPSGFTGIDVDRNAFRHFALRFIESAKFVRRGDIDGPTAINDAVVGVSFVDARNALHEMITSLTGEQLAEVYSTAVAKSPMVFDKNTGRLVSKVVPPYNVTMRVVNDGLTAIFTETNGKFLVDGNEVPEDEFHDVMEEFMRSIVRG